MKLVVILSLVVAAVAAAGEGLEPIVTDYHVEVGIPEAARILKEEQALFQNPDAARIVGGSSAFAGQFPYQAGLVITLTTGATSVCGASLLTNTRLVTAAHCWFTAGFQARSFEVVLGSTLLFFGGTRVTTSNVETHANYNFNNLNNDVAIISISSVALTNNIQPISLASGSNAYTGNWVTASGFGRTSDSSGIGTLASLSHVNLNVITNLVCALSYGTSTVISSTLCTSGVGGVGTCGGDSGGPVVLDGQLVGIVSFGSSRGCQIGQPAGHARVTAFNSWITARL